MAAAASGRRTSWRCAGFGALTSLAVVLFAALGRAGAQPVGDLNCDSAVNAPDLGVLARALFGDPPGCGPTDINGDGSTDGADMIALLQILDPPPPTPVPPGPQLTFFGLASSGGTRLNPLGKLNGDPVFFRNAGFGFKIVVEAASGQSGLPAGVVISNTDPRNPARRPDLQIEANNRLGDGSPSVCDGGVPAVDPPDFGPSQAIADALNDFACSFAVATSPGFACTLDDFSNGAFLGAGTQVQFCLQVPASLAFGTGDTTLSVQTRDIVGNVGPLQRLIVRVGSGPAPPTFTPRSTATPVTPQPTRTASATRTRTATLTATRRATATPSRTPPATATAPPSTPTRSPTQTPPPTVTGTAPPSRTTTPSLPPGTPVPSSTRIATLTPAPGTPTSTRPPTALATPSRTLSPTPSPTRTTTRPTTPNSTSTRTTSPTRTRTQAPTASPTVSGPKGPVITFFGLTDSEGFLIPPSGPPGDLPLFVRQRGASFSVVVEGKPGSSGTVGKFAFQPGQTPPDLQVEVSRQLGDGSTPVCDTSSSPSPGGVPATDPPIFDSTPDVINALNDLGCRFVDGNGAPVGRKSSEGCVEYPSGDPPYFGNQLESTLQFCGFINRLLEFPSGDTVLTARLLDEDGNPGAPKQIVIHVGP